MIGKNKNDKVNKNNLRKNYSKTARRKRLVKRIICLALSFILLSVSTGIFSFWELLGMPGTGLTVRAEERHAPKYGVNDFTTEDHIVIDGVTRPYYIISSKSTLIWYTQAYYDYAGHGEDAVRIDLGAGEVDGSFAGFESIGNDDDIFHGVIIFGQTSQMTFNLDCPFFGTVYDSVRVIKEVSGGNDTGDPTDLGDPVEMIEDPWEEEIIIDNPDEEIIIPEGPSEEIIVPENPGDEVPDSEESSEENIDNEEPGEEIVDGENQNEETEENGTDIDGTDDTEHYENEGSVSSNASAGYSSHQGKAISGILSDGYLRDEPANEEITSDQPAGEESESEQPASEQPASEEPASEESASEEPPSEQPAGEETTSEETSSEEIASEETASEEISEEESSSEESVSEELESEEIESEEVNSEEIKAPLDGDDDISAVEITYVTAEVTITRVSDGIDEPLFARRVVHYSNSAGADWSVKVEHYTESGNNYAWPFAGFIGLMDDGAIITLTAVNNAKYGSLKADILRNSDDVGLLCCKMADNASLTATYSGSNTSFNISTQSGNAGGLVGSMGNASVLTVNVTGNPQSQNDEISTVAGYAGAIVGENDGGSVTISTSYIINQKITGTTGVGSIYGFYRPSFLNNSISIDVKDYNINTVLNGSGAVGGLYGILENAETNSAADTITITSTGSGNKTIATVNDTTSLSYYGGLIGLYRAYETSDTLQISKITTSITNNASAENYGGAIGCVDEASYVSFDTFTLSQASGSRNTLFGGLVASAQKGYIYVKDVTIGSNLIDGFTGGGIVGDLSNGVLGLTGTTNVSNAKPSADAANGQLVGIRADALIYADADVNWTYTPNSAEVDNVGSWGDVLIIDGTKLKKNSTGTGETCNVFTETAHIISIDSVSPSAIANAADFAKTSLLFQINPANNSFLNGTQLETNVSIGLSADIDLTGTGLRGITRDSGSRITYSGTVTGGDKKIVLDIKNVGQSGGNDRPVYYHRYNGLFGVANNVTVNNLNLDGSIMAKSAASSDMYAGSFAAYSTGTFTASGCNTLSTLDIVMTKGTKDYYAGRFVGSSGTVGSSFSGMNTVTVSSCIFDGTITGTGDSYIGGVFGKLSVDSSKTPTWTFSNVKLKGTVKGIKSVGGLVAYSEGLGKATIKIGDSTSGVVADDGFKVEGNSSDSMGGLLGYSWSLTDVEIVDFKVSGTPIVKQNSSGGAAGLVYRATGHWTVNKLYLGYTDDSSVSHAVNMQVQGAGSVGMIVNKGKNGDDGIYLELPNGYDYRLAFDDSSVFKSGAVFDEICAYSADNASSIMNNGQAIVSISTNGLKMETTPTDSLSYKNQTDEGADKNPNTRYYYNLDKIDKDNTLSLDADKLMRWGVNQYACGNIKSYFPDPFAGTIPAGSYDMKGYSWYPVSLGTSLTVNGTFKFYNKEFTECENVKDADNKWLPNATGSTNQHYMMQNGLFYNVTNNLTIKSVTLQGTIGAVDTSGTGALVYGTVSGSSSAQDEITVIDSTSGTISLDGIKVWNFQGTGGVSPDYAPLLINKTGSFVNLKISNVSTTSTYSSEAEAATSLIGYAGLTTEDTYITVGFTNIKLDARSSAGSPVLTSHGYPTTKSIFTRATLLERLVGESGTYTYSYNDDWGTGGHNVTYGKEVGYSTEGQYPAQEQWYARTSTGDTKYATSYTTAPTGDTVTDTFGTFLPYVKTVSTPAEIVAGTGKYYQLKVNHQPSDVIQGCGTYNDPYIIKTAKDLENISKWIVGGSNLATAVINAEFTDKWCNNKTEHKTYSGSTGSFVSSDSSDTKTYDEMRMYLCEAYYSIEPLGGDEITINTTTNSASDFTGLGVKDSGYRFRGVIIGNNNIITNKTPYPFIAYSDGSVIKDLTIKVDTSAIKNNRITCQGDNKEYINSNQTYTSIRAYGAVCGQIVGGDNIIDNVQLDLSKMNIYMNGNMGQYVPVGGYVGVIINGGLMFRNMQGSISGLTDNSKITNNQSKTTATMIDSDNNVWMFVNPIIGRVINGYAVTESGSGYKPREANVTMKNSTGDHTVVKNYSITDIATSGSVLSVDSNNKKINVPDSQAFVLMSFIVNSGMGANLLGYQNDQYFMRRHAAYDSVGSTATSASSCDDYYSFAKNDSISSTPYLISKYAGGSAPIGSNNWTVNLSTNGNYDLSDGFRGIGNFFNDNDSLRLNISTFNGNGSTVNQNTKYYYYSPDCVDAYRPANIEWDGLGLINCQNVSGSFSNLVLTGSVKCDAISKDDYTDDDGNQVSAGNHIEYKTSNTNANRQLSAAMLIGVIKEKTYATLDSVALQNVDVKGVRHTGGLVGNVPNTGTHKENNKDVPNVLSVTNTLSLSSFGITVHGAGTTGGMIGRSQQGSVTVDNNNATYSIVEVVSECTNQNKEDYNYGVGGFIGICRGNGEAYDINISNVIVGTKEQSSLTEVKCPNAEINTGGMVGILNNAKANLSNCKIYNQSVSSQYTAGGLVGYVATLKNYKNIAESSIAGVIIECKEGLNGEIISTNRFAGGFIGACKYDSCNIKISDGKVKGYTISGPDYAGGIVGLWSHVTSDGNQHCQKNTRIITNNVSVENCNLRGTSDNSYVGGLIGYLNVNFSGYNYNRDYYGYNILENNVNVIGTNKGCVCGGTSNTTYNVIKLVGFSRQEKLGEGETSSMIQETVGSGGYGTGGYVIFADYLGKSLNETPTDPSTGEKYYSTTFSNIHDGNNVTITYKDEGGNLVNYPYVTSTTPTIIGASCKVNNTQITGAGFVTGDGVSAAAFSDILNDMGDGETAPSPGYYDVAKANIKTAPGYITDFDTAKSALLSHTSTFQVEMGSKAVSGIDFPLLVVDDVNVNNTTAIVNNYLRMLTNTDYDFNNKNDTVCTVQLSKCTFSSDGGTLSIDDNSSCLGMDSLYFFMKANDTDTKAETAQFTLIDVQFKNPSVPTEIAYHLYVPVYVRKLLQYDFDIRLESGTDFVPTSPIAENTLLENLGVPITVEFQYKYSRNTSDWQKAVDGGDNLLTNYNKKLVFTNSSVLGTGGVRAGFEAGNTVYDCQTKMVLIDSNNSGKAYYLDSLATTDDSFVQSTTDNWLLDLQKFKTSETGNHFFTPQTFNSLMTITATSDTSGNFVCISDYSGTPTVEDNSGLANDGKQFRLIANGETVDASKRYSVTVSNADSISEHYFLTIYTTANYSSTLPVYHYVITSQDTLGYDPYPSRADNRHAAHLLTGDIYSNSMSLTLKEQEMDMFNEVHKRGDDYLLQAELKATVAISQQADPIVSTYLRSVNTIEIYQSFLATLNIKQNQNSDRGIKALKGAEYYGDHPYTINGSDVSDIPTPTANSNFVEFRNDVNLRNRLAQGAVEIKADISLVFDSEDITGDPTSDPPKPNQFLPDGNPQTPGKGTTLIASSNIASNPDKTAYSKVSKEVEASNQLHYYNSEESVKLIYNAYEDEELGQYGQLGINANDLEENPVPITTLGAYDVSRFQSGVASAESLQIEIEMLTIDNGYATDAKLDISNYLTAFGFVASAGPTSVDTTDDTKWVYVYPKNAFGQESGTYQIPINYSVYTGKTAAFEDVSRKYSNYEVKITVSMLDENGDTIPNSNDTDYIKYTNARIYTGKVNPNKADP